MAYAEASTYNEKGEFDTNVGAYTLFYVISTDNGRTWSRKMPFPSIPIKNGSPFGKIILLPNGTAIMPVYGGYDSNYKGTVKIPENTKIISGLLRSTDNGRTWGDFSIISVSPCLFSFYFFQCRNLKEMLYFYYYPRWNCFYFIYANWETVDFKYFL